MRSDRELMTRIGKGDAEAFEVLFTRYRERVYRRLMRMMRDAESVEDLMQEVFLRVWTRAEQWDDRGPCLAWLFRIATNQALNAIRTRKRRQELPLELPIQDEDEDLVPGWMIDAASLGPEALCEQAEQSAALHQLIDRLPEEKREVIRLVHEAEMDIREVSERLGIPEGTVKSRLYYARKHLAQAWHNEEDPSWE